MRGRRSQRIWGCILRLYPRSFRERFGQEILAALAGAMEQARSRGRGAWAWSWFRATWDLSHSAVDVWARHRHEQRNDCSSVRQRAGVWLTLRGVAWEARLAARSVLKAPWLAGPAIVLLALGVGLASAALGVSHAVLVDRPYELDDPERLFLGFREFSPGHGGGAVSHDDYRFYRDRAQSVSGLAAFSAPVAVAYSSPGSELGQAEVAFVSHNFFDVLGVPVSVGRSFVQSDDAVPGETPVVVVGHAFATGLAGDARHVLGQTISLNGLPHTIVGVLDGPFDGLRKTESRVDLWVPIAMYGRITATNELSWWQRVSDRRSNWLTMVGRLKEGSRLEVARGEVKGLSDQLRYGERSASESVMVTSELHFSPRELLELQRQLRVVHGVVACLLLVVFANLTLLLLARARSAIGAARVRMMVGATARRSSSATVAEALVLGVVGSIGGVAVATLAVHFGRMVLPFDVKDTFEFPIALVGLTAAALGVGLGVCAALPAAATVRRGLALFERGPRTMTRNRAQYGFVAIQVALGTLLLAVATVLARSHAMARSAPLGFDTQHVTLLGLDLRAQQLSQREGLDFMAEARHRLTALPGVQDVAFARMLPFGGDWTTDFIRPGDGSDSAPDTVQLGLNLVSPNYFDVLGIPLVQGGGFEEAPSQLRTAVVNRSFASYVAPDGEPVGRVLELPDSILIVGVVADATYYNLGEPARMHLYLSGAERFVADPHLLIKVSGDPAPIERAAQTALRTLEPSILIDPVTSLDNVVTGAMSRYSTTARIVSALGAVTLLLALVGLSGLFTLVCRARMRDLGVRLAVGAPPTRLALSMLSRALAIGAVGSTAGLLLAFLLRDQIHPLLFPNWEPSWRPYLGSALVMLLASVGSAVAPTIHALRANPLEVLRCD